MELIRGLHNLRSRHHGSVLTIGNFDGLHPGHRAVVSRVLDAAGEAGVKATVVTFEPLPREHFAGGRAPGTANGRVQGLRDRLEGLAALGVDQVLCLRFDARLAAMPAEAFALEVLRDGLGAKRVVVGGDFRFGRGREGDLDLLERLGFRAETVAPVETAAGRVSSTRIRASLAAGDLEGAAATLGRRWGFSGRVGHGDKRGRSWGFPTANLRPGPLALAYGVYAVRTAEGWPGAANWGLRPMVAAGGGRGAVPQFEVHLIDREVDLYGRRLRIEPVARIRDEARFDDMEALVERIGEDVRVAKELLGRED